MSLAFAESVIITGIFFPLLRASGGPVKDPVASVLQEPYGTELPCDNAPAVPGRAPMAPLDGLLQDLRAVPGGDTPPVCGLYGEKCLPLAVFIL